MLMKAKPFSMINREGVQIVADAKGEAEVPENLVPLCKLYGWSPIVLVLEKTVEEVKKDIAEEKTVLTKTTTL